MHDSKVIIALDYSHEKDVFQLCNQLDHSKCKLKIGKQLFTKYGPKLVEQLSIMSPLKNYYLKIIKLMY